MSRQFHWIIEWPLLGGDSFWEFTDFFREVFMGVPIFFLMVGEEEGALWRS